MSFSLFGIGLSGDNSITFEEMENLKKSDKVYFEVYTSKWEGNISKIEELINKKILFVKRLDLEENSKKILEEAKSKNIAILVLGDPLVATTHITLLLEAKKMGIKTKVIHNASIYSAVGETGLHLYKFGATVTIPFPEKTNNQSPLSTFETIKQNRKLGWHTLCLLDLIAEKDKYMSPNEGTEILLKSKDIKKEDEVVIFGRAGSEEPLIAFGKIKDLVKKDFGDPPFVLIVPGKLHFTEKEFLEKL